MNQANEIIFTPETIEQIQEYMEQVGAVMMKFAKVVTEWVRNVLIPFVNECIDGLLKAIVTESNASARVKYLAQHASTHRVRKKNWIRVVRDFW